MPHNKSFCLNDSIRETAPEETLQALQQIFPKIGITRVAHVTHFDHFYGVFVSNCIRPNSQNLSLSQGKGSTLELSMISAIMESIEAYHVENPPTPKFKGSFESHKGRGLVNPELFCLTEFKTDLTKLEFRWGEATDVLNGESVLIPFALSCINTCQPNFDYLYFNVSSNGLAAGNSKEEAMCHGILEIIERDALAKWQKMSEVAKSTRSIMPDTVNDFSAAFIDKLAQQGLTVRIWEITSDLDIPAYHVAIIDTRSLRGLNIFTGTGAHLSKSIALFRALSEAIQGRLTYITGARDDVFESYYKKMRLDDRKFLPQEGENRAKARKNYADSISLILGNAHENLKTLVDTLTKYQYSQLLMIDHTKPELGIPVVQMFIPRMLLNNVRM